jgi:hypothetical protein
MAHAASALLLFFYHEFLAVLHLASISQGRVSSQQRTAVEVGLTVVLRDLGFSDGLLERLGLEVGG